MNLSRKQVEAVSIVAAAAPAAAVDIDMAVEEAGMAADIAVVAGLAQKRGCFSTHMFRERRPISL
jgi:hypothetical protein